MPSVLAGNHDVSGDDTRGSTPYLTTMGPQRFKKSKTFAGSDSSGYNTAHVFPAGGREWLLLAMDCPQEPVATLSFSNGREPQWNSYPLNITWPTTNWGQGLPEETWWHLAVVNDGKHTVLYIDGCPTVDNPTLLESVGITQLGLPWALGGYEYGGAINQIFHGWVGDVRIVNRPLPVREFLFNQ